MTRSSIKGSGVLGNGGRNLKRGNVHQNQSLEKGKKKLEPVCETPYCAEARRAVADGEEEKVDDDGLGVKGCLNTEFLW
ncbi:unnamed protein product [Dibothriocephalus latus]|uniref:Uncharacterized protein n=1 Tax=Dibothriocephalus latus TaxID=60516 RepID=A0A3P7LVM2_DIBLA|nr:unnamed protein product [Dibothriocephalus latus]